MPFGVVRPLHLPILPPPPGRGRQRRSSFPMRQGNAALRDQAAPTGASTILGISRASDLCARTRMPGRHAFPGGIGMTPFSSLQATPAWSPAASEASSAESYQAALSRLSAPGAAARGRDNASSAVPSHNRWNRSDRVGKSIARPPSSYRSRSNDGAAHPSVRRRWPARPATPHLAARSRQRRMPEGSGGPTRDVSSDRPPRSAATLGCRSPTTGRQRRLPAFGHRECRDDQ